ncbi:MAG TPA: hypothetical protein PLL99_01510 [Chitinophagales bacterium]|jgi:hypothetical protein|nr:hypothetical protein [Chitinophagales bacterium]HQG37787.1 hypothetical protein [Chitinophagales bacterium]
MNLTIGAQREQLKQYIEKAEDKKIAAFYTLLEKELQDDVYTDEFKTELDKRYTAYTTGKIKMITPAVSKRRINKLLQSKFGK